MIRRDPDLRAEEGRSLEAGRTALVRLLAVTARRTSDKFIVVFDGAPGHGAEPAGGRIVVMFARAPATADDVLKRLARQHREGAVVVTSDRAVQEAARREHAVVVSAEDFVDALANPARDDENDDDEDDRDDGLEKRGNPRRRSREERAARRVLARLRRAGFD